ncbi:hypothetical protein FOMPIDRAFT_1020601 [Fomitopsis schrenkii]|uniref:HTH CENPB-type domain-containing protein n=1 Tax=Fomitopsis schrenkii TaxID=2126942 RepID=S8F372_FOMSC|nr:hypothetical protein FOMPIDRAFT_1020601 [Fomitopsis schrenkii]
MSHPNPPRDTAGGQSHETDGVRRRRAFSFADKKRICEAAMANPRLGCTELANHLGINKYVPTSITRRRKLLYEPIEADLASWLRRQLDRGYHVGFAAIRAEALRLVAALNASNGTQGTSTREFKCSKKWIHHFRARHGFKDEYTVGPARRRPIGTTGAATKVEDADDDYAFSDEEEDDDDDDDDDAYIEHPKAPALHSTRQAYYPQDRRSAGAGPTPSQAPAPNVGSLAVFGLSPRAAESVRRASGHADYSSSPSRMTFPESHSRGNSGSAHHTSPGRAR